MELEFDVLRAFLPERSPLTKRQVAVRIGTAVDAIAVAIDHLCACGQLVRLNTLIESFALPYLDAPSPRGASMLVVPAGRLDTALPGAHNTGGTATRPRSM